VRKLLLHFERSGLPATSAGVVASNLLTVSCCLTESQRKNASPHTYPVFKSNYTEHLAEGRCPEAGIHSDHLVLTSGEKAKGLKNFPAERVD
jgi:hypothetical protein